MKIQNDELITKKEGYEAMLLTLLHYYEFTGSTDLTDFFAGGYFEKDIVMENGFWEYWLESIEKLKKDGPYYIKLYKDI